MVHSWHVWERLICWNSLKTDDSTLLYLCACCLLAGKWDLVVRCTHFHVCIKCVCNFKTTRDIPLWYVCQCRGIGTVSLFVQCLNEYYATCFGCNQKHSSGIMKLLVERVLTHDIWHVKCLLYKYFNNAWWLLVVKASACCIIYTKTPQDISYDWLPPILSFLFQTVYELN